jgi:hypothetical protein
MFGRSNGFYGQLWGSELVDLHELPPGSDPTVLAMDPWKKKQMENDLVSVCLVRQCQYVPIG